MQKYVEWYPWFAWLCVLGERKSNGQVAKIDEKNVKFLFLLEVLKMIFSSKVNACQLMACKCLYFFLLPLGFPGGNQVDGSPPAAKLTTLAFASGNGKLSAMLFCDPCARRVRQSYGRTHFRIFANATACEETSLATSEVKH